MLAQNQLQTPALRITSTGMTVSISSAPLDKITKARFAAMTFTRTPEETAQTGAQTLRYNCKITTELQMPQKF